MSIEYTPKLIVGWRVEQNDIPDFDKRYDEDWSDLEELAKEASKLLDNYVWTSELCDEEDSWCGDTHMVGVPMLDRELPMGEFVEKMIALAELAERVYRQVMRKEPEDGPYLISWTQVS